MSFVPTPDGSIFTLPCEVLVFGGTEYGTHINHMHKDALTLGASYRIPHGLNGQTYAIPIVTKDLHRPVPRSRLELYIDKFLQYAIEHKELLFHIQFPENRVADLAPLLFFALPLENVFLPKAYLSYYGVSLWN